MKRSGFHFLCGFLLLGILGMVQAQDTPDTTATCDTCDIVTETFTPTATWTATPTFTPTSTWTATPTFTTTWTPVVQTILITAPPIIVIATQAPVNLPSATALPVQATVLPQVTYCPTAHPTHALLWLAALPKHSFYRGGG